MSKGITLDLDAINVTSFETSTDDGRRMAKGVFAATRHTGDPCCNDETVCLTYIECSSGRCA